MEYEEITKKLNSLIQLDIDAIHAYEQAMKNINEVFIRDQLAEFRNDHHRHFRELSAVVQGMGGSPPDYSPDFKGFLIQGFTAMRSVTGTEGALKAMESNEKLTNKTYEEASSWDLPLDAISLVRSNFDDEKLHIRYIQTSLRDRIWEGRETTTKPGDEARL
ncbi:MAG: DUF2383 domain-containing protein [Desulfobacterales bacterium]|nr:DUF2383 domain-containing protein [Desulfobacterales bacterium]